MFSKRSVWIVIIALTLNTLTGCGGGGGGGGSSSSGSETDSTSPDQNSPAPGTTDGAARPPSGTISPILPPRLSLPPPPPPPPAPPTYQSISVEGFWYLELWGGQTFRLVTNELWNDDPSNEYETVCEVQGAVSAQLGSTKVRYTFIPTSADIISATVDPATLDITQDCPPFLESIELPRY